MQKLMISKQIMDKHNEMGRGNAKPSMNQSAPLETFNVPQAKYNIPSEFMQQPPQNVSVPRQAPSGPPTIDAIKNSRLPDEIKKWESCATQVHHIRSLSELRTCA